MAVYPADTMPPPYPVTYPVKREEGIARYRALLTPDQYRARLATGQTEGLAPGPKPLQGEPPVFPVVLHKREEMAQGLARYEFKAPDGGQLPPFEAGGHIDVVIAPEYQRPYSLAGDPADRSRYVLGVLREPPESGGRGGSALMHRAFREGRRVFVSRPVNHFALHEDAAHSCLFAGGIGVTPLIAMAHRLHALGKTFDFHYSAASRQTAGFLKDLAEVPWRDRVQVHFKDEGRRADLMQLVPEFVPGQHVYTCGSPRFMDGVFEAAQAHGWPQDALHREYFSVPEADAWVNQPFELWLQKSGRRLPVPAERSATEVLAEAGLVIDVKCSDGLCGVCARPYDAQASDAVEHRDFVLSQEQRQHKIILCCSRAQKAGGVITLDL
jgi:ferredoxin-NADP reductase